MRALRRRAIGCAAAAATGAVLLAGASAAQAQKPESVGNGVPTGQGGVQMFNYGGWLNNAGGQGANPPAEFTSLDQGCLVDLDPLPPVGGGGPANDTRVTPECRLARLEALFAFLRRKGVTNIELFGHSNFPASTDIPGLIAYRALLDKYGLHAGGWHGSMNEAAFPQRAAAAKILGADYIGSGGVADPGINSYDAVLRSAQALNRMGKIAVEMGVGPTYIHNHEQEFDRKYVDNGVLKSTYDILMERTDPRYVVGELDVFWSSDAFNDLSGEQSAAFINKWDGRIQMLHVKDGINAELNGANSSRAGSPRAFGTGTIDFRPIFAEALGTVRYYHQEQDSGTLTDADVSLTNLKGVGPASVGTLHVKPPSFPSVPANTPGSANVVPVLVQNTGDQPLTITGVSVQSNGVPNDAGDFQIISHTCTTGGPLAAGDPNATPAVPRGSCVVNVGFRPSKTNYTSVARLQFASGSDAATESILLAARSTGDALGTVGGDVPSVLNLSITNAGGSFGTFVPAVNRSYETALSAVATTTTGDATLSVTDWSTTAPGHLVNQAFSLPSALRVRALGEGDSSTTAFQPLAETAGLQVPLKAWGSPITGAPLTLGFQQAIGASDVLRAGTYSKTLTFTLSTNTP
jgi:sugar phosphate isomerase/epimerase